MCGISGCIELVAGKSVSQSDLDRMTDFMFHRGPDGRGVFVKDGIGLGHRRLSIIDLDAGQQPFVSACGRYVLTYNGEIYNYIELRAELEAKGRQFKTHSDTEVLLYALIDFGKEILPRLNGMFAFAFVDLEAKTLLLARDHLGIKPLYYSLNNERMLFASDLGALACHAEFNREPSWQAASHYFSWRVFPCPYTAYENTYQLEPGSFLILDMKTKQVQQDKFWEIPLFETTQKTSPEKYESQLAELLEDALRLQVRADVPVGAFLSGGVDSSTVAYWMSKVSSDPITFTIGFPEKQFDESEWADDVAKHLGTRHYLDVLEHYDLADELHDIVYYFNQPNGTGIPNYFVSRLARRHAKVALAGVGGDEVFAGYGRFNMGLSQTNTSVDRFLRSLMSFTEKDKAEFFTSAAWTAVKGEPAREFIKTQHAHKHSKEMINQLCYLDLVHFMRNDLLVNLDKMSMAHSLEVRVPLLDYRLIEFGMTVPPQLKIRESIQKLLLKRSMYHRLPRHVFLRKKKGFSLPKEVWVKKLEPTIRGLLSESAVTSRGLFDYAHLLKTMDRIFSAERVSWRDANNLWNILMYEMWATAFVDKRPEPRLSSKAVAEKV